MIKKYNERSSEGSLERDNSNVINFPFKNSGQVEAASDKLQIPAAEPAPAESLQTGENQDEPPAENIDRNTKKIPFRGSLLHRPKQSLITKIRLDEIPEKHLEAVAESSYLLNLIESGSTVSQAIKLSGSNRSRRAVQDLKVRAQNDPERGRIDKRWQSRGQPKKITDEITKIALSWFFARPAAGYRAIAELTIDSCREKGLVIVSQSTIVKYLYGLPENIKLARKGKKGMEMWQRQNASVTEQKKTTFANELWQGDHHETQTWVRKKVKGKWIAVKSYLSAFVDDFSRACPGYTVSTKFSDAWSISILSYFSFNQKDDPNFIVSGYPFGIENDCGRDWISKAVQTMWKSLDITPYIDYPYYPNSKGKVERFFRTLDTNLLRKLPGHFEAIGKSPEAAQKHVNDLLTIDQLRRAIHNWIVNKYHQRIHSETGRKPIELWKEEVRYRPVKNIEDLNIFLLKYDVDRTILNCGIRLTFDGEKHRYWSPEFDNLSKRKVALRYNPEDLESVYVYCAESGEFLCEAWDTRSADARFTYEDIKKARNEQRMFLRDLRSRSLAYYEEVLKTDRIVERQDEWREAEKYAATMPEPEPEEDVNHNAAIEELLNNFKQNDRSR